MVIDQLTARGVMEPSALYDAPFSSVHAGGPEVLFAGKSIVIDGIFEKLKDLHPRAFGQCQLRGLTGAEANRSTTGHARTPGVRTLFVS